MEEIKIPYVTRKRIKKNPLHLGELEIYLLCSDSIGAKSSSIFINYQDSPIIIDPGVAALQPGYPLNETKKQKLAEYCKKTILKYARKAKIVVITHYHYDHLVDPVSAPDMYLGKSLFIKNPNIYINKSQWNRARNFFFFS